MPEALKRIMVVASADSPLLRERVVIPRDAGHEVIWFSESVRPPKGCHRCVHAPKGQRGGYFVRLRTILLFWKTYFEARPDIVHVHWVNFPALLLKRKWTNLVVSPMGSDIFLPGVLNLRRRVSRGVLRRAQWVTSKSVFMDRQLEKLGVSTARIERITWGVSSEFFRLYQDRPSARRRLGIEPDCCVFFSPRANKPLYRIDEIIRSFRRFILSGGEGRLLVAEMYGTAATRAHYRDQVPEPPIRKRIEFLGSLNRARMQQCYAAADVVVSYATTDGMPQTLYEAMAAGCFPVFSNLPQYRPLLKHGDNSFLCLESGERSLTEAYRYAQRLIAAHWNPEPNREKVRHIASRDKEMTRMNRIYDLICPN
jgi:glycosyltransferase involved in cell wall biosynthesis